MFSDLVRTPDIGPLIVDTVLVSGVRLSMSFSVWFGKDCELLVNARAKVKEVCLINLCDQATYKLKLSLTPFV